MRFLTADELAERERRKQEARRVAVERAEAESEAAAGVPPSSAGAGWEVKIANELVRPAEPKTFEDAGLSPRVIEGLILRTIKQHGTMSFRQVADAMHLNLGCIEDTLRELRDRKVIADLKPLHYDLTELGRKLCYDLEREDAYIGPAPVPFEEYCNLVLEQAKRSPRITEAEVLAAFEGYALRPELVKVLKEGFNSQRSMFFYGPAGNGKTLVTGALHRLLDRWPVVLPYAFEFNGRVVRVYDPAYHSLWHEVMNKEMARPRRRRTTTPTGASSTCSRTAATWSATPRWSSWARSSASSTSRSPSTASTTRPPRSRPTTACSSSTTSAASPRITT